MQNIESFEGSFIPYKDYKIAIVAGRFNDAIVSKLIDGAIDVLVRHQIPVENIKVVKVPGAFEIPLIVQQVAQKPSIDAVIALGAVIRGSTPHFDFVANEATKGLAQIALNENKPIANGVLTVDSIEQAIERAGTKMGNKGAESALVVIEMLDLQNKIDSEL